MALERTTRLLDPVRASLLTLLTPVTVIAESPYLLGRSASRTMATREQLIERNRALEKENLELSHLAQQYRVLRAENDRLLALAGSRARLPAEVLAAEIVGIVPAVNTFQVVIDKGAQAGVEDGYPVIDAAGLFGQVVEVGRYTSRVLLVADKDHAVPVEVNRNGVRSIAGGSGRLDRLELEYVPVTTDIQKGDLLVTSGLGGRFPRGYPVGTVLDVVVDANSSFAVVSVVPAAELDRSRHVLVVVGDLPPHPDAMVSSGAGESSSAQEAVDSAPAATGTEPAEAIPEASPPPTDAVPGNDAATPSTGREQ